MIFISVQPQAFNLTFLSLLNIYGGIQITCSMANQIAPIDLMRQ